MAVNIVINFFIIRLPKQTCVTTASIRPQYARPRPIRHRGRKPILDFARGLRQPGRPSLDLYDPVVAFTCVVCLGIEAEIVGGHYQRRHGQPVGGSAKLPCSFYIISATSGCGPTQIDPIQELQGHYGRNFSGCVGAVWRSFNMAYAITGDAVERITCA